MAARTSKQPRYLDPAILQKIGPLDLVARQIVEGIRVGMHHSPLKGFSTDFLQHRQYVPGDELKHIDWKVYARSQRYNIKMYEAETDFAANLLLDVSSSMTYGSGEISKLEYAKFIAACLSYLIVDQRDAVGLAMFDDELRKYIEPKSSYTAVHHLATELRRIGPRPRTNIATLLHEFAQRIPRRGFVILFSDLFDHVEEFMNGLSHLRFKGHNVIVFHVMDPYELTFPLDGTWRFKGLENEGEILTQPKRIRAAYLHELRIFLRDVRLSCERSGIDYLLVDTSKPIEEVLSGYLIRRTQGLAKH